MIDVLDCTYPRTKLVSQPSKVNWYISGDAAFARFITASRLVLDSITSESHSRKAFHNWNSSNQPPCRTDKLEADDYWSSSKQKGKARGQVRSKYRIPRMVSKLWEQVESWTEGVNSLNMIDRPLRSISPLLLLVSIDEEYQWDCRKSDRPRILGIVAYWIVTGVRSNISCARSKGIDLHIVGLLDTFRYNRYQAVCLHWNIGRSHSWAREKGRKKERKMISAIQWEQ